MKPFNIYIEHYTIENNYTVYIHHYDGSTDLVHPLELAEDISINEAQDITNNLIARYSLHGTVMIHIYQYEGVFDLKNVKTLTTEEFNQSGIKNITNS